MRAKEISPLPSKNTNTLWFGFNHSITSSQDCIYSFPSLFLCGLHYHLLMTHYLPPSAALRVSCGYPLPSYRNFTNKSLLKREIFAHHATPLSLFQGVELTDGFLLIDNCLQVEEEGFGSVRVSTAGGRVLVCVCVRAGVSAVGG